MFFCHPLYFKYSNFHHPFIDSVSSFLKSRKSLTLSFFYFRSCSSSSSTGGFFLSSSSRLLCLFTQSFNKYSLSPSYTAGTLLSVRYKNTGNTSFYLGGAPSLEGETDIYTHSTKEAHALESYGNPDKFLKYVPRSKLT